MIVLMKNLKVITIRTLENPHSVQTSSKKEDYRNTILKVIIDNQIEKIRVFDEKKYVNKDYDLTMEIHIFMIGRLIIRVVR